MTPSLKRFDSVDELLERAGPFLEAREAEHNLLLGICASLRAGTVDEPPYLAAAIHGGRVLYVAIRTPPYPLALSEIDDPESLGVLLDDLSDSDLPGVIGPKEHVGRFAQSLAVSSGRNALLHMAERIHALTKVRRPRPVPGRMRPATEHDRDLLIDWLAAFGAEALHETDSSTVPGRVDRSLNRRILYLWEDERPVSFVGSAPATGNVARIGPVYTPPERSRRGFASALVATVTDLQLESGHRLVCLYTDLANPTSNHIYAQIGFRPVRDVEDWRIV